MSIANYSILYVEDDDSIRSNIVHSLSKKYTHVYEASNGKEAYALYTALSPDIIITDIEMPQMDGLTLVETIRSQNENIPIIIITAFRDSQKLLRAVKLNLVDYLVKPVSRNALKTALQNAFNKIEKEVDISPYNELLEAVVIVDENFKIIDGNDKALALFQCKSRTHFKTCRINDFRLMQGKIHEHTIELKKSDYSSFVAKVQIKDTVVANKNVKILTIVDLSQSILVLSADPLTELQTRRTLEREFTNIQQLHKLHKKPLGAIFIDVDNFKKINDTCGHQFGDDVLKKLATIFRKGVRQDDVVVRWGGDEFFILLHNSNIDQTEAVATTLREAVLEMEYDDYDNFSCSFGIDTVQVDDSLNDVTKRIDKALLVAKKRNKNCIVHYIKT